MAHYAGLIAAGAVSEPGRHRGLRDEHDAQDAARSARRTHPHASAEHEKVDQLGGVSRAAGRAADARHRRQGGRVARKRCSHDFKLLPGAGARERARAGDACSRARGLRIVSGGTDSPHVPGRPAARRRSPARTRKPRFGERTSRSTRTRFPTIPKKPFVTSGIRIGSPAITTRGFSEIECEQLAHLVADVLEAPARRFGEARTRRRGGEDAHREVSGLSIARDWLSTRRPGSRAKRPDAANDEMPILRQRATPRVDRFARVRARRLDPARTALPRVPQAVHDLRERPSCGCRRWSSRRRHARGLRRGASIRSGFSARLHKRPVPTEYVDQAVRAHRAARCWDWGNVRNPDRARIGEMVHAGSSTSSTRLPPTSGSHRSVPQLSRTQPISATR